MKLIAVLLATLALTACQPAAPAHVPAPSSPPAIVAPVIPVPSPEVAIETTPAPVVEAPIRCEEDMPCWDCATMGNKLCGPVPAPVLPERIEEDDPRWDCHTMGNRICGLEVKA